jgi:hypothetical protein
MEIDVGEEQQDQVVSDEPPFDARRASAIHRPSPTNTNPSQ